MIESVRARQAWADYLGLGPDRSLAKLLERYQSASGSFPTKRLSTLKSWSVAFVWQARLTAIADQAAKEAEESEAVYRRDALETGFALAHERVRVLKQLARQLFDELTVGGRLWLSEPKQVGAGQTAMIEHFNAAEIEQFRGLLADIAKEKGERKDIQELSGPHGGPIEINGGDPREELARRIQSIVDRARSRQEQATYGAGEETLKIVGGSG